VIKKQVIEGATFTRSLSPIQTLRDFFDTEAREAAPISRFSGAYRTYRKKVATTGRLTEWKSVTAGTVKEKAGLQRIKERRGRTAW